MDELLSRLKVRLRFSGTVEDAVLSDHLQTAVDVVNDIRQYTPTLVEPQYRSVVVEMALVAYNKMGAEGQNYHAENGVDRRYESGSMYPNSLLKLVIPRFRGQS
jgi:hypothetical protein